MIGSLDTLDLTELLAGRLVDAIAWLKKNPKTTDLKLDLFGSSTGAVAALIAPTRRSDDVRAIVSRGGRPDMAMEHLADVKASILLILGGRDRQVIRMNGMAMEELTAPTRLEIVPGTLHLFEEPGMLEEVASLATEWFSKHLVEI